MDNDIDARPAQPLPRYGRKKKPPLFFVSLFAAVLFIPMFILYGALSHVPGSGDRNSDQEELARANSPQVFANIPEIGLSMYYPAEPRSIIAFGYHEANNDRALAMAPVITPVSASVRPEQVQGRIISAEKSDDNFNTRRVHFLMNTRGRGQAPTSAVDVPVIEDAEIKSPVSGTVRQVRKYMLYGKLEDNHVEIEPEGMPGVRVVMIHIKDVKVKEGDKVVAGRTQLAKPRHLTRIGSQIDRYLPQPYLHVHIQVNPADAGQTPLTRSAASAKR